MLRALRALLAAHHLDRVLPLEEIFSRAQWRVGAELPEDRPFVRLTPQHVARIAERYAESNEEFVRDYFGGRHSNLFSIPEVLEEPSAPWSPSTASEHELRVFPRVVQEALGGSPDEPATGGETAEVPSPETPAAERPSPEAPTAEPQNSEEATRTMVDGQREEAPASVERPAPPRRRSPQRLRRRPQRRRRRRVRLRRTFKRLRRRVRLRSRLGLRG